MNMKKFCLGLAVISVLTVATSPAHAEDWKFNLGLYAWLAGVDGTVGAGDAGDADVDASFSDIASFVDFAMGLEFQAIQEKYILGGDWFWVDLGAERPVQINGAELEVDLGLKEHIAALGGAYRVTPVFDLWVTGRLYTIKTSADFQGSDLDEQSHTWIDIYGGVGYHRDFGKRVMAAVRADVGAGGSDFAWYGNAVVGYHFTNTFTMGVGYRVLSLDYVDDGQNYFKYDVTMDGLGIFMNFGW